MEKLLSDFREESFKADSIIKQLFNRAKRIPLSKSIITTARLRIDLGNPPGKHNSYGDAVNWESLLESVPKAEDLHFITDDGDFFSESIKDEFSVFLAREWANKKRSKIIAFRELSQFFREKFPNIRLASELEKELLINALASSPNFSYTKLVLRKLVQNSDFNKAQLNNIVLAVITNNQVYWIIQDEDVKTKILQLIGGREEQIDRKNLEMLYLLLQPPASDSEEQSELDPNEIPF